MWTRRGFCGALGALSLLGTSSPARASSEDTRLVLVLLRGGLDGLSAVAPLADDRWGELRGELDGELEYLDLDHHFGLHPALAPLHPLWRRGELGFVHGVGLDYGARSHFDAQDQLENGSGRPRGSDEGWLGRALAVAGDEGLAFGKSLPLVLRGEASVSSLDPGRSTRSDEEFLQSVERLYAADARLGPALLEGLETRRQLEGVVTSGQRRDQVARSVAAILRAEDGPRVGVLELGGWDTHVRQRQRLDSLLGELAEGLATLSTGLGPSWERTLVVVVSEFGRTVRANGTAGTDHGHGGLGLVLGGLTRGGQLGDWPGLGSLFEDRDLRTVNPMRGLFKGALQATLGLTEGQLAEVFPGTEGMAPLRL
jgi:uncharacterized protein (DUF1501 family)